MRLDPRDVLYRRRADYRTVFLGTAEGRRVLADLIEFSGMARQMHVPGDPFATTFNDGRRRVGLRINSFLNMTSDKIEHLTGSPDALTETEAQS